MTTPLPCARHEDAAADFRCTECDSLLCAKCADPGSRLIVCRLCGERAVVLDELERPAPHPTAGDPVTPTGPISTPSATAFETPALGLANHVIVPTATILMVAALLFFLLDLRSIFFGGTAALKWVGFWFVTATVLIARYGKASLDAERQGCYTLALAGATVVAMTVAPWESPPDGPAGPLTNVLIVLGIWRFASRLTESLSFEGLTGERPTPRLYGQARLELEQWRREQQPKVSGDEPRPRRFADPNATVARWALGGLVVFALGEPFLLSGPPAVGERALAAMVVFLLATGVVLACSAGVETWHRVRSLGGEVAPGTIPTRMAGAALAAVVALALSLAMPGVEYRGDGSRARAATEDGVAGGGDRGDASQGAETEESGDSQKAPRGDAQSSSRKTPESEGRADRSAGKLPASSQMLGWLAELGAWLKVPFWVAITLLGLWGLWHFRPRFGAWGRRWLSGLRGLLGRWMSLVRGAFRRRAPGSDTPPIDPFADLAELHHGEPKAGVIAAYGRLLSVYDLVGHPRPERRTPYELVASLPGRLGSVRGPAEALTEAYVKAAYSPQAVTAADRLGAVAALEQLAITVARSGHPVGPAQS